MSRRFLTQPQSVRLRRALFHVHRWVGLAFGLYVLAISLSGSILIYRGDLDALLATRSIRVTPQAHRLSDAQLLTAARAAYASFHFSDVRIHGRRAPDSAVQVWLIFGGRRIGPGRIERLFNPYTGQDLGDVLGPEPGPISWIGNLHERLLAGATGLALNGAGALLLTLLCMTGAVIWWPGSPRWRRSMLVRLGVGWRRLVWDLHSFLGFWVFLLILMWSVTGFYLAFPDAVSAAIRSASGSAAPTITSRTLARVIDWLVRLHFARSFGPGVQAALAVMGLAPAALFVTGALMWWNRVLRRCVHALSRSR